MKKNIKKIIVSSLAIVMVASTVALTAPKVTKKNIPATFGKVNVTVDGKNVTDKVEGFISNGTTYMPLRAISNVFGYNVSWNAATDTAFLNSSGENVALLKQQIALKDLEISRLKAELDRKGGSGSSDMSIRDLESQLDKDYRDFEKLDFKINLRGDDRRVDLEVEVDLGRSSDRDRWNDLSDSTIERFIEDMVRDIQREYRDADVDGYIRDSDEREDLYTFEKRGNRSIDIKRESGDASPREIERFLDRRYSKIDGVKIRSFDVRESSSDKYKIIVEMENDTMSYGKIKSFYDDVIDDVEDEYRRAKVDRIEIVDKDGDEIDTWRK